MLRTVWWKIIAWWYGRCSKCTLPKKFCDYTYCGSLRRICRKCDYCRVCNRRQRLIDKWEPK